MFILKHVFQFQDDIFIQMNGTAMGTKFAPCFANLYVGDFKGQFIQSDHPWKKNIISYLRYIDDLMFVWEGTESDSRAFTDYLNFYKWGLTFTGEISSESITFLDLTLFAHGDNILTKTFFKKTDSNSFFYTLRAVILTNGY